MKHPVLIALFLSVLALGGLFVFKQRPAFVPRPSVAAAKPVLPASTTPAASPAKSSLTTPPNSPTSAAGEISPAQKNFPAGAEFLRWAEQFTNSTAGVFEGERLAWKRREAMLELIQNDPQAAIEMAVPFELRQRLPRQVTRFFEEQLDGRGNFDVLMATDFARTRATTYRYVALGGKNYEAFVYGRRLAQICQTDIPLHGVALDGKMAVATEPLRRLTAAEATALDKSAVKPADVYCSVSGQSAAARKQAVYAEAGGAVIHFCGVDHYELANGQSALAKSGGLAGSGDVNTNGIAVGQDVTWTHGSKSLLFIRVNFPDDLTEPVSAAGAYAAMAGVNTYFAANSYNLTAITTTVTPLITMPQTKAWYTTAGAGQLQTDARAWAKLAGYATANYDRDIVELTSVPGYDWGGLAYVGGKGVWLQGMNVGVAAHELGHNYGLLHANYWDTSANLSGTGPGTHIEYGNNYDTMGSGGVADFNAAHKNLLDWLKADAIQPIGSNGVYRIYPFDVPAADRVAGRYYAGVVKKDFLRYYWLEFRRQYTSNPWLQNGVLLNWSPWTMSSGGTHLLDATPGSPTPSGNAREDAAVVIGRTFNDNPAGVHITTLARGSDGAQPYLDVQVNLGAFPGNQPPVVAVEMDQTNAASGAVVHLHATATDADGDALAYAWTFDDFTFATNNLPWISKSWATEGDHVVRCVVSDMKGGVASYNAVVTVGSASGFHLSGRVTDENGNPLEGVLVSNGSATTDGFVGGYTDSDGRYVIVNATGSNTLNAAQFGYTFGAPAGGNPVLANTNRTTVNFVGVALPVVSIAVSTNSVVESDSSTNTFTVTRTGSTSSDLTVNIYLSGTATLGTDYTLTPNPGAANSVTIPAGTNSATYTFQAINNPVFKSAVTATLTLVDETNATSYAYVLGPLAEASITVLDATTPTAQTVTVSTTTPVISENGTDNGQLIFARSGSTQNGLLVYYSLTGTAAAGVNYAPLPGVALIPAGQGSVTIPLVPLDDHVVTAGRAVTATISGNAAYSVGSPGSAQISILDNDLTTVTVSATDENAAEPSASGTFTIQRVGDLTDALVINYTVGGTAVPGVDYSPMSGTVTIAAGATTASVTFTPLANAGLTPDKYVTLVLTNNFNYDVGTPGSASIFITESERPTVSISAPASQATEQGDVFGQFVISRTTTSGNLTVYLNLSGTATSGSDYVPLDNPVVIPDGASSVTLDVIAFHDLILEPTETVELVVQTNASYNVGSPSIATVQITDDATSQKPGVGFCFAATAFTENLSPGLAVGLSTSSSVPVTVSYHVIGGTAASNRYSLPDGQLTIPANDLVGFIPLAIVNNATVEPPQTIRVTLFNPTNATLDGIKIHTYTIIDDDVCSVSVSATAPSAAETGLVAGNFRLTRVGSTNASQLVNFQITGSASAPTDYASLGTSATIPAGATQLDLPVIPVNDVTTELPQTVKLTLISAPSANIISPNVATVTIADNDTNPLPVVTITSTNHPYAIEGGVNGEFLFTRSGTTTNALTIPFTISGTASGSRYGALPSSVTIPIGQASVTLPVVAVNDQLVQGEQTVIVTLTEGNSFGAATPAFATVTIQDNDQRVWLDASDFLASKFGNDPGQFTFTRFGLTNAAVTINYTVSGTASNGVDYVAITNRITIPANQLAVTLPILPQHNGLVKGPVTVTLALLASTNYFLGTPTNGTVIIDDDMPMLTLTAVVTNVLEGSGSNGVFRLTRTGDPKYDFTANLAVGGVATYGVDYPPFPTNVYFTCGVISIDLLVTPTNEVVLEGDELVTVALLPDPAYTRLAPSNAALTIVDAGTNQTPLVTITLPTTSIVFLNVTNDGLVLNATVADDSANAALVWSQVSGPANCIFGATNLANTAVQFTNAGIYLLRLTADDGQLQGHADLKVFVTADLLSVSNTLHWTFDEGAGTNVTDVSGAGRDGILDGAPVWLTNGVVGGALNFSGTNDGVRQVASTNGFKNVLNGLRAFTVSLWLNPADTNADRGILTADESGTNTTFSLAWKRFASCGNASNVVEAAFTTTKGANRRISASNALRPGAWQHVALTWTNGGEPKLYFNGQLDSPLSGFVTASGMMTNCPQFIVGKGAWDSPAAWNGLLDDVRVFSAVLSADEILALAASPVTNHAPVESAGTPVTVQLGDAVTIAGTVSDDGLPIPPAAVTNFWTYLGTNIFAFTNAASLTNTFIFTVPGDYIFRLTAFDGAVATFNDVTVTVLEPATLSASADVPDAYELGPVAGNFTLSRTGNTNAMTVYFTISGIAENGLDYVQLTNTAAFPAGTNTVSLPVTPYLDYFIEGDESVILTVLTNIAYNISSGTATVTIHDSPYGVWSIQRFSLQELTFPNLSGPSGNFVADGIPNFAKYAFNLDPKVTNASPPYLWSFETNTNDGLAYFTLTYTRRRAPRDVEYGVYVSTNLFYWNTGTNFTEEFMRSNNLDGLTETVKTRALQPFPAATNLFMNIRVWLQQVPAPAP